MADTPTGSLRAVQIVTIVLLTALVHFLRFGYDFGVSDQDELVPAALHALDTDVLNADWFVRSQAAEFNVRTPTVAVLSILGYAFGIRFAVTLLYVVAFVLAATGIVRLTRHLSGSALAAVLAPVVVLVLTPRFTVGGNDVTASIFVPSMMAWGIAIHGVVATLEGKALRGGLLFGLAVLFQPLAGILVAGTTATAILPRRIAQVGLPRSLREWGMTLLTTAIMGSPLLIAIAADQISSAGAFPAETIFHILVEVRAPHHFLPSAFPLASWLRFGALSGAGLACVLAAPRLRIHRSDILTVYAITAIACALYTFAVEVGGSLTVAKMQLFKLTVLVKILAGTATCVALIDYFERIPARANRSWSPILVATVLGCIVTSAVVLFKPDLVKGRVALAARAGDPWSAVYEWASAETDKDAVFAVPPSNSSFRSWARRPIVSNFKAFAFQDSGMVEWYRRISDLTRHPGLQHGYVSPGDLDASYERLTGADLTQLADRYGISYVARSTPLGAAPNDSTSRWSRVYPPVGADASRQPHVYALKPAATDEP